MTDAERLDELRELVNGERPALSFPAIDGLRLVLAELDAVIKRRDEAFAQVAGLRMELDGANKTISEKDAEIERLRQFCLHHIEGAGEIGCCDLCKREDVHVRPMPIGFKELCQTCREGWG